MKTEGEPIRSIEIYNEGGAIGVCNKLPGEVLSGFDYGGQFIVAHYTRHASIPMKQVPFLEEYKMPLYVSGLLTYVFIALASCYLMGKAARRGYANEVMAVLVPIFWPVGWIFYAAVRLYNIGSDAANPTLAIRSRQ